MPGMDGHGYDAPWRDGMPGGAMPGMDMGMMPPWRGMPGGAMPGMNAPSECLGAMPGMDMGMMPLAECLGCLVVLCLAWIWVWACLRNAWDAWWCDARHE